MSDTGSIGFLDQALVELHLPASVWAAARELGLRTLRDLASVDPAALKSQFAVTGPDFRYVAHIIRSRAGRTWQETFESAHPAASNTALAFARWASLGRDIPSEVRDVPLGALSDLSPRAAANLQHHGLQTLGEVLSRSPASLLALPGFGPESLAEVTASIASYLAHARKLEEDASLDAYPRLSSFWAARMSSLPPRESLVLAQRDCLDCPARRIVDLAASMGVSRERVRQLEKGALSRLTRDGRWVVALDARLRRTLPGGPRPVDAVVAEDPWLADLRDAPAFMRYVFERVLGDRYALRTDGGVATVEPSGGESGT